MDRYIPDWLRRLVATRANYCCEYCLLHQDDTFFGCEVDHIISMKHGGQTVENNLAYTCFICNRRKGSDIGSILWKTGDLIRFFNPRTDSWKEHFILEGAIIKPQTDIGEVTARILDFNNSDRILERQVLIEVGRYPMNGAE